MCKFCTTEIYTSEASPIANVIPIHTHSTKRLVEETQRKLPYMYLNGLHIAEPQMRDKPGNVSKCEFMEASAADKFSLSEPFEPLVAADFIADGLRQGFEDLHNCAQDNEMAMAAISGVQVQLQWFEQGELNRAHELARFMRNQEREQAEELYVLTMEVNNALDNGADADDIHNLGDAASEALGRVYAVLRPDDSECCGA